MDSDYIVVVADGASARFFSVESPAQPALESGPRLFERDDLVNTEHELGGGDKYSTTRSGLNLNPRGGPSHGYDDHRAQHEQEHERRFARDIAARALSLAQEHRAGHLVVAAERHMLGLLREALEIPVKSGIEVSELAKDLTRLAPAQVYEHLAAAGVVPAPHAPKVG
jgi:protein required for attachment to host cells